MNVTRIMLVSSLVGVCCMGYTQQCESPYFLVESESAQGTFPLLSTTADVKIIGPIADVRILQNYRNDGDTPIEAIYVFPASTQAAVYHMEMRIGERVITAKIMERNQAKQKYETAKQEGKRASLLEQSRPNVFQMHVANILPGEEIKVEMRYTEFIIPESQEYEFVYPTVVGPRYNGSTELTMPATFASTPYTHAGITPSYTFDITVRLQMPVPITQLSCKTHQVSYVNANTNTTTVKLCDTETSGGNRDYILKYALAGGEIASGVLTYAQGDENYFLCQLEAPKLNYNTLIVPREYIFILDISGSMNGYPLDVSKELMRNLLSQLRPTDKFNMLFFAGSAFMLNPVSLSATKNNLDFAFHEFQNRKGAGGTELLPALRRALGTPKVDGYARSFVIVTDGYVTVEEEAFRLVQQNLNMANFFAFGIGNSVNRHLIEGLAHVGRGEPFIVTDNSHAQTVATKLKSYIEHPVLTNICIDAEAVQIYDIIPENIPDLMAARPIYFFGKYIRGQHAHLNVKGKQGNMDFSVTISIPEPETENAALRYLWAREKIRYLDDFNTVNTTAERISEITELGLAYNLLTQYTSFVAVDEEVVNDSGLPKPVKQTLPLPQGVSNFAVGFELELEEIASEPSTIRLLVDVTCADRTIKIFTESIMEIVMQSMPAKQLLELNGMQIHLEISPSGNIRLLSGDVLLARIAQDALNEAIRTLHPVLDRVHEIIIRVHQEAQMK